MYKRQALHGVHEAMFVVILSPVGSYFKNGLEPVKIMVETEDVRAVRGGTGEAKCGGNYGAANRAGDKAIEKGFSQVLWLDGVERKYVEEGGGMNIMFKIAGKMCIRDRHKVKLLCLRERVSSDSSGVSPFST